MKISHNNAAFSVWKDYTANSRKLSNSMGKLSSGSRLRSAADGPSDLAMSERMRSQGRNTAAAANNVENKLNYLQTADSWLQKIHDMLGRMSELAITSNDGTKSGVDREILQKEFAQLQKEIQRITSGATAAGKFNGLYLFRGGTGVAVPTGDGVVAGDSMQQVGPDSGMTFTSEEINLSSTNTEVVGSFNTYSYGSINMTLLGSSMQSVTWASLIAGDHLSIADQTTANGAVAKLNIGIDFISEKRAVLGSEMKRMEHTLESLRTYEENIRATESRIRDVDVAKETTEMSKYQVLQQVGTAMLAQANQVPQNVMQLLG